MRVAKYCEQQFNINTCNTLQVGTFEYYSKMDPSFSIADVNEGWVQVKGFDRCNSVHGDVLLDSNNSAGILATTKLVITPNNTGDDIASVKPKLQFRNCYIYCMSLLGEDEKPNPKNVDEKYDDFFLLNSEKQIQDFSLAICSLLHQQIKLSDLNLEFIDSLPILKLMQSPIQVSMFCKEVSYGAPSSVDINKMIGNSGSLNYHEELLKYTAFQKESKYSMNKELRFLYMIHQEDVGLIPVKAAPKIIDLKPILKIFNQ